MSKINRFRFCVALFVIVLTVIVLPLPTFAQSGGEVTGFKNVKLWIYPEHDDPRLLVMLEGQITGAQPPARVKFLVPSAAEMYSAGSMDVLGKYTGGPPARQPSSMPGLDEISYSVTTETFRVEYYDPIILGAPNKTISYQFRTLYPVSGLSVIVQEPKKSTDYSVQPPGQLFSEGNGFNAYMYTYSEVKPEAPLNFQISYTKSDPRPSLEIDKGGASPSSTPADTTGLIVIVIVVVVVAGIGLFWFFKSRRKPGRRIRKKAKPTPASALKVEKTKKKAAEKICEDCGAPMSDSSRYCPQCGQRQD